MGSEERTRSKITDARAWAAVQARSRGKVPTVREISSQWALRTATAAAIRQEVQADVDARLLQESTDPAFVASIDALVTALTPDRNAIAARALEIRTAAMDVADAGMRARVDSAEAMRDAALEESAQAERDLKAVRTQLEGQTLRTQDALVEAARLRERLEAALAAREEDKARLTAAESEMRAAQEVAANLKWELDSVREEMATVQDDADAQRKRADTAELQIARLEGEAQALRSK
ncbi:hypothetical protein [Demequina sp. NBRC 110055]|uniref:hypothetical protein n=1 Tax=Demequina sp. NBRC 110055 TaxID=1570344 RepID=UPI000A012977|nr:hypothetical protein [Demequina sp. NBRC 110055]